MAPTLNLDVLGDDCGIVNASCVTLVVALRLWHYFVLLFWQRFVFGTSLVSLLS